jgi:hypothetical protein
MKPAAQSASSRIGKGTGISGPGKLREVMVFPFIFQVRAPLNLLSAAVPARYRIQLLQPCQGSGVGSIPIGRSILFKHLGRRLIFHFFQ